MDKTSISPTISLLVHYSKQYPRSMLLNTVLLVFQLLTVIVMTHDWNISFGKGISFWIRKLIFIRFFAFFQKRNFYRAIILTIFFIGIIHFVFFFKVKTELGKYNKPTPFLKKAIRILSFFLYIPFYFLNQFLYSIYIEALFCGSKPIIKSYGLSMDEVNACRGVDYIIFTIIIIVNVLFSIIFTIVTHIILYYSFYIPNGVLINSLGSIHFFIIASPFLQAILQLEYHITFTNIFIIKNILRGLYVIMYIWIYVKHYAPFTHYTLSYIVRFILSMCFVSCCIEWGFAYDYSNYASVLIKDTGLIILKLLIEGLGAKCILFYYHQSEFKMLNAFIKSISSSKQKTNHNVLMEKFFLFIYQLNNIDDIYLLTNSILNVCKEQTTTPSNSNKLITHCFFFDYLSEFKIELFQEQQEQFMELTKDRGKILMNKCQINIKDDFPLLFAFVKYSINLTIAKIKGKKNSFYLNAYINLLLFDLIYEKNILKCLLTIEKIKKASLYKKNYIFQLQVQLMHQYLVTYYKQSFRKDGNDTNNHFVLNKQHIHYQTLQLNFKSLQSISLIEFIIKDCLQDYISIMNVFNEEDIQFNHFISLLTQFNEKYNNSRTKCQSLILSDNCCIPYSSKKFELFFSYFQEHIPSDVSLAFDHFFTRSSLTTIDESYSILLLKVDLTKDTFQFTLNYASDDIIKKLNYNYDEFHLCSFDELFPKNFLKPYFNIFKDMIVEGKKFVKINNFCVIDKDKFVLLFDLIGIPVFSSNTLKLFIKLVETKEEIIVQIQRKRVKNKRHLKPKANKKLSLKKVNKIENDINNFFGNCYFFTNKSGKIFSISKQFGYFFYLTTNIIAKHKLNVREFFGIEVLNQEGFFIKSLNDIYDNIIQLNNEAVGQLGEDDFSKAILSIKETQRNIGQNDIFVEVLISYEKKSLKICSNEKWKSFYIFALQVHQKDEIEDDVSTASPNFKNTIGKDAIFSSFVSNANQRNLIHQSVMSIQKTPHQNTSGSNIDYRNNKIECQEKILIIRNISLKLLEMYFGYKVKIEGLDKYSLNQYDEEGKEKDSVKETTQHTTQSKIVPNASLKVKETKALNDLIRNKYLYSSCNLFKEFGGLIVIVALLGCFISLSFKKLNLLKESFNLLDLYGDFSIVFIRLIAVIQNVLHLQIQSNSLQTDTIDDGFLNSFDYYHDQLPLLLEDYDMFSSKLNNFIQLQTHPDYLTQVFSVFNTNHLFNVMNRDGTKGKIEESLESINYIPLNVRQIIISKPFAIYYNKSDYYVEEVESYYSQYEYVKLIENFILIYRYVIADTMLSFPFYFIYPNFEFQNQLNYGLISQSFVFVVFIYLCLILFIRTKKSLFAKYFINYTQLRFFNLFIMKKTQILLDSIMNNGDNTKNMKDIIGAIGLVNDKQDIINLKYMINEQNNSDISTIRVNPFKIKLNKEIIPIHYHNTDRATIENINTKFNSSVIHKKSSCLAAGSYADESNGNPFKSKRETYQLSRRSISNNQLTRPMKRNESQKQMQIQKEKKETNQFNDASSINTHLTVSSNKLMLTRHSSTSLHANGNNGNTPISLSILNNQNKPSHQARRKLLDKQFNSLFFLICISLMLIALLLLDVIQVILSSQKIDIIKSMIESENCIFHQIELISSLLVIYQISVLKDQEITTNYISKLSISFCEEGSYSNKVTNHYVFNEVAVCLPYIAERISKISMDNNVNTHLITTSANLLQMNSDNFCNHYAKFFSENKSNTKLKELKFLNNQTEDELKTECDRIGSGFNSEGYSMAINSMETTILSLYKDFMNDHSRNEISNYERMNNKNLQMMQAEYYNILQKIPFLFLITFSNDYEILKTKETFSENIFFLCKLFMIIVISSYYFYTIFYFAKEEKLIEFFNESVLNTILF